MLGVPLAREKTCNPSQVMAFLGIELSSLEMMAQLPVDKLRRYSSIISDASKSRKVKLCEMKSIFGCLQFATSVIVPGQAFIRRLIDWTIGVSVPFHYVTLNEEAKKDLDMWKKNSAVSQWQNHFYITDADFWRYSSIHWCLKTCMFCNLWQAMVCDKISIAMAIKKHCPFGAVPNCPCTECFWHKNVQ